MESLAKSEKKIKTNVRKFFQKITIIRFLIETVLFYNSDFQLAYMYIIARKCGTVLDQKS